MSPLTVLELHLGTPMVLKLLYNIYYFLANEITFSYYIEIFNNVKFADVHIFCY